MRTKGRSHALLPAVLAGCLLACGGTPEVVETYGQTSLALTADADVVGPDGALADDGAAEGAAADALVGLADAAEAGVLPDAVEAGTLEAESGVSVDDAGEAGAAPVDAAGEAGKDGSDEPNALGNSGIATRADGGGGAFGTFAETHFAASNEGGCSAAGRAPDPALLALLGLLGAVGVMRLSRRRSS
jgi:hypothetical protein